MIRRSRIAPAVLLNESLGFAELIGSPMCVNGMKLLNQAHDQGIALTKSGAFFRKFVTWAAEDFRWPDYETEKLYVANKVLNEPDFPPLAVMHELMLAHRLLRHYKSKAVPTKAGRALIGDYGALQAGLFDAFFVGIDHSAHERFPIEYADADVPHFLGVVRNCLDDWVPLWDLAVWCLPVDLITTYRISPRSDACFYLFSRLIRPLLWLGLIERKAEKDHIRIEDRRYRKTPLCDRFLHFGAAPVSAWTIH